MHKTQHIEEIKKRKIKLNVIELTKNQSHKSASVFGARKDSIFSSSPITLLYLSVTALSTCVKSTTSQFCSIMLLLLNKFDYCRMKIVSLLPETPSQLLSSEMCFFLLHFCVVICSENVVIHDERSCC